MSDQRDKSANPVLSGLVALVAVGLAVGLLLGGVALVATKWLGVGDGATAADDSTARESLYLPKPQKTEASGPQITLRTEGPGGSDGESADDLVTESTEPSETESTKKDQPISLQASPLRVANFGEIDLTGVYPGGEGAVLQVQRLENGQWADFDAMISVSDQTFATYIQTGVNGVNKFRVIDTSTGKVSNVVSVTVGA